MTNDRNDLGRNVRDVWVAWASRQLNPKPSWLVQWDGLDESDREVDRQIGEALYARGAADIAARDSEIATLVGLLREVLDSDSDAVKETELGDRIRAALENNRGGK